MKNQTSILVILLVFCLHLTAAGSNVLPIVKDGLGVYGRDGAAEAIKSWLKNSPLEFDDKTRSSITGVLSQVESAYGKFIGWEQVHVLEISKSVQHIDLVIKYEKGPLFATFDCYKPDGKWIVFSVDFNTKLQAILSHPHIQSSVLAHGN